MGSTRALWMMIGFGILLVRLSEARAADRRPRRTRTVSSSMSATTSTPWSSYPEYGSSTEQTMSGGGNGTMGATPTPTPMTTNSSQSPSTVISTTNPPVYNYSSTINGTWASNSSSTWANSTTPPPYVDMYGNNLPKVVNASVQFYENSTDMMDALPVVPLMDDSNNGFGGGNNAWIIYRIPAGAAPPPPLAMQQPAGPPPPLAMQQPGGPPPPPNQPNQPGNYGDYGNNVEQGSTPGCPNPEYGSPPAQQPPVVYEVVVQPLQAYQADYNNVDNSTSSASIYKPLDDFFNDVPY